MGKKNPLRVAPLSGLSGFDLAIKESFRLVAGATLATNEATLRANAEWVKREMTEPLPKGPGRAILRAMSETATLPPDRQPPGGWRLRIHETGGTVEGATFGEFCRAANEHLRANGHETLEAWQLYSRIDAQTR